MPIFKISLGNCQGIFIYLYNNDLANYYDLVETKGTQSFHWQASST